MSTSASAADFPFARTVIALDRESFATVQRAVRLLFEVAHGAAYRRHVDEGAGAVARHDAGNTGVFMGFDFHLTPQGPRLIEINTNAGGALVNGLHTASRLEAARLACLCSDLQPIETMEERIVGTFRAEFAAARPGGTLRRAAIVDENPCGQFLYREFELVQELLERAGVRSSIADTGELQGGEHGVVLRGDPVDLVYLRDTDFQLEKPRSQALRSAWLAGEVVLTPSPREHHLLADKRRLVLFSSESKLRSFGLAAADAEFLAGVIPETHLLAELGLDAAWQGRRDWVFKPAAAFGSRGVYRGDKISRRKLEEIAAAGGFVAQRAAAPGEVEVSTSDGPRRMKFDVRAYAYRDEILLLGARVYEGQVTNLRTPGGGFSAICVCAGSTGRDRCSETASRQGGAEPPSHEAACKR